VVQQQACVGRREAAVKVVGHENGIALRIAHRIDALRAQFPFVRVQKMSGRDIRHPIEVVWRKGDQTRWRVSVVQRRAVDSGIGSGNDQIEEVVAVREKHRYGMEHLLAAGVEFGDRRHLSTGVRGPHDDVVRDSSQDEHTIAIPASAPQCTYLTERAR